MVSIKEDQVIGSAYSVDVSGGAATRVFSVAGLPNVPNMLYLATITPDSTTGFRIPVYGQGHPSIPGLYCQKIDAAPLAGESRINAKITCSYGWYVLGGPNVQVRISGMRSVNHANRDPVTGRFFQITYVAPAANGVAKIGRCYAQFDIYTSNLVAEVTRLEKFSPKQKSAQYCGKVNSEAGWQGVGGNLPALWMCQNIDGTQLGANAWNVCYRFEYNPYGWAQVGEFQDDATGKIPTDIIAPTIPQLLAIQQSGQFGFFGSGVSVQVPTRIPFNALNIPIF